MVCAGRSGAGNYCLDRAHAVLSAQSAAAVPEMIMAVPHVSFALLHVLTFDRDSPALQRITATEPKASLRQYNLGKSRALHSHTLNLLPLQGDWLPQQRLAYKISCRRRAWSATHTPHALHASHRSKRAGSQAEAARIHELHVLHDGPEVHVREHIPLQVDTRRNLQTVHKVPGLSAAAWPSGTKSCYSL